MRLFLWDESKHMQGRGLDKYVISVYRLWQIVTYLMQACNTDVLQVYIKYVTSTKACSRLLHLTKTRLLLRDVCWVNLWLSELGWLLQIYWHWGNCDQIFKYHGSVEKRFRQVWSYLHSSGSIWLPRNGVLKYRDGSLDTRMRSELWLRRGSS